MQPIINFVGYEAQQNDTHIDQLLRATVLQQAISFSHTETINWAYQQLNSLINTGIEPDVNLRNAIYIGGITLGDLSEYNYLFQRYQTATVAAERIRCLNSLAYSTKPYLLQHTLDLSISSAVRSQDTVGLIARVAYNVYGQDLTWQFFVLNYQYFYDTFGGGHFLIERLISSITQDFTTVEKLDEVQQFFELHPISSATNAINQSIETIQNNINFLQNNADTLSTYIQSALNK